MRALQVIAKSEVQTILVASAAHDLGGYFFVGYEGHWSEKIAFDAAADDMASALAGIPAVGDVKASRHQIITKTIVRASDASPSVAH